MGSVSVEEVRNKIKQEGLEKTLWAIPAADIEDKKLQRHWKRAQETLGDIYGIVTVWLK